MDLNEERNFAHHLTYWKYLLLDKRAWRFAHNHELMIKSIALRSFSSHFEAVAGIHVAKGGQPHDVEHPEQVAPLLRRHRLDLALLTLLGLGDDLGVRISILKIETPSNNSYMMASLEFRSPLMIYEIYSIISYYDKSIRGDTYSKSPLEGYSH